MLNIPRSSTHTLTRPTVDHSSPKSPATLKVHLKIHTCDAPGMLWKKKNTASNRNPHAEVLFLFLFVVSVKQTERNKNCSANYVTKRSVEWEAFTVHERTESADSEANSEARRVTRNAHAPPSVHKQGQCPTNCQVLIFKIQDLTS